jgi:hypothetical protein
MKKIGIYCFIGAVLVGCLFPACSPKKEPEGQKGAIKKMTDKTAKEIVDQLQKPINKARDAAREGEKRVKVLDEMMKKQ